MSYYITDDEIRDRYFEGETVPGDNSIDAARNTSYKGQVTDIINDILWVTSNITDTYKTARSYALILYGRLLDNDKVNPVDEEADAWWIKRLVLKYGNPPLSIIKPSEDWSVTR
jgi:hypothetical protein